MNWVKRDIVKVWLAVATLIVLFPHYTSVTAIGGPEWDAGWGFVLKGPATVQYTDGSRKTSKGGFNPDYTSIDLKMLAMLQIVAAGIAVVAYRNAKAEEPPAEPKQDLKPGATTQ